MNEKKIVIVLPLNQYEYLMHVFEGYTRNLMTGDQLLLAANTRNSLMTAQELPNLDLGDVSIEKLSPSGIVLSTKE